MTQRSHHQSRRMDDNPLTVTIRSQELFAYTVHTARNEKFFPLRYKEELSVPVVELARHAMHCIAIADSLTSPDEQGERLMYQKEAKKSLICLRVEITANLRFKLPIEKSEKWIELLVGTLDLLKAWIASDRRQKQ